MMHRPWDCAQPDEWLPQSLRLCWGGDGGDGSGGDGGFGGPSTGGGDWGSSGSYDASGFDAGGAGFFSGVQGYDASMPATTGGGDWGSFGATNYSGFDAPNATFADVAGPNPGVTTGGGDWGSAGVYSAAGMGGGLGGGLYGGGGGGGVFGDYGGGGGGDYGGGYTGGGGQQGGGGLYGGGGGGSFGGFGTGTLGGSNAYAAAPTGPTGSAFADSYGGGSLSGPAGQASSGAPTTSEAQEESAGPSEGVDPGGEQYGTEAHAPGGIEPGGEQFGEPTSETSEAAPEAEAGPSLTDGAPAGNIGGKDDAAPASQQTADRGETEAAPSAFGPQSLDQQSAGEQGTGQQQDSFDSRFGFETAAPQDSFDSRFGFDTSAPAPSIEATIPGGQQTDFDYGPGQQTAAPNFDQVFADLGIQPGWDLSEQTAGRTGLAEPTDWAANPYQPSTDVSVGRDFNQAFDPFGDTPTGMDLAGDMRTQEGDINPNSLFQAGWAPDNAYEGRGADYASGRAAQDYVTSAVSGAPLAAAAPGLLSALSAATGLPAAAWLGGTVPTAGILGLMGLDPSARPTAPQQDQDINVELVPADQVPAAPPPPPQEQQPQEAQPAPPQEAQPTEAQPQEAQPAPPQEAQPAPPQEAQPQTPQEAEQTQPQEAQPAPPSLVDMVSTPPPQEATPAQPPGLVTMLPPPALTPTTPADAPSQQPAPAAQPPPQGQPGEPDHDEEGEPQTTPAPGRPLGAPTTRTQNTPVNTPRVRQEQQGGTRNRPVSEALHGILTRAAEQAGVVVRVGSGGQIASRDRANYRQSGGWTGSHRHDNGNAADIRLEQNGRLLNYNNPQDRAVMEAFVREAARLGATGMGAGMAYMGPNTIHVGFGGTNFWNADNPGSRALRQAWQEGLHGPANRPPADIPVRTAQPTIPLPGRRPADAPQQEAATPSPIMIGLKGKDGAFDAQAFNDHAAQLGYRGVVVNSPQEARSLIDQAAGKVGLYGFSAGANAANTLLGDKGVRDKVDRVVTVAPFHSQQTQNFKGTNWDNFPDYSSRGIDPQGQGFQIQTRAHTKEAQREAATGQPAPAAPPRVAQPQPPPADIPANIPLQQPAPAAPAPVDRPLADIPVTLSPPVQPRANPKIQTELAQNITTQALKGIGPQTTKEQAIAKGAAARATMIQAGIPGPIANAALLDLANKTAAAMGYARGDYMGMVGTAIDKGIAEAMQGYQPAKPGAVQGPPAPSDLVAPGKRSDLPSGQQYADLSQSVGPAGRGDVRAPSLQDLSPLTAPPAPAPSWGQPPAPPPPPQYRPGDPGMFNPFRGNEARELTQPPDPNAPPLDPNAPPPPPVRGGRTMQAEAAPSLMDMLGNVLSNFNPISTAEAKGRGRDSTLEQALALAREGGNFGGQRGTSVVGNKVFTFYAPGASGPRGTEGPMVGSKGNPLTTLDDVRNGAGFVSLAGHPNQFGQQVFIGNITYTSPVDGQQYTLNNVVGRVDDTGGKFGGKDNPDQNHFDIAVGNFSRGWNDRTAGSFVASNYATAVPGRGIGSDYAADDQGTAVAAQPPAEAAPAELRGLAKGGHVDKDEKVVVGEEGPEFFIPDEPGTVVPHMPQARREPSKNIDRWPKIPAPDYPGRYGGVEREILRQTRAAQDPLPSLMDMVDSGRLPLNAANWHAMLNDPALIALGQSRMDDRREGIDPGAEQYGAFIPPPAPAVEPPDPTNPLAQALGYGSIKRRPMQIGRQSYQP